MTKPTTPVLHYARLKNSSFPTWLGLIAGSWLGLLWGGLISSPVGVGFVVLGTSAAGAITVPMWGTFWGLIGLGRARDAAANENGTQILPVDHPLTQEVYRLCDRLGMEERPWVGIMPMLNAYAIGSGPDKSLVVVGSLLLEQLEPEEVSAIIGHELGHIANNDMRRMSFAKSFQNALVWFLIRERFQRFGRWLLTWGSELMVLGLSRKREYWADAIGAALTSPRAMVTALYKLHGEDVPALTSYESLHARMMFRGKSGSSLLSTHPTLEERVSALQARTYLLRLPYTDQILTYESPVALPTEIPVARPAQ